MIALLWQTALLLLGAYFLGAFTGCLIRRTFFAAVPAGPIQPQSEAAASEHPLADPEPIPAPAGVLAPSAYAGVAAGAPSNQQPMSRDVGSTPVAVPSAARPAATATGARPAATPARPTPAPAAAVPWAPTPPAGAGTRSTEPATAASQEKVPQPEQEQRQPPVADRPSGAGRSIGTSAAAAAALAAATARHQAFQRAQAEDLAKSAPAASGTVGATVTSAPSAPAPLPPVQPPASAAPAPAADDLTRIRGIDPELQDKLNGLGVRRFAQIAEWRKDDIRRINAALGFRGRIEQENWIEQAQILMTGSDTAFSRRRRGGEVALAQPTKDEGQRVVSQEKQEKPRPDPAASALAAAVASSVASAPPRRPVLALGRDNLQRISRIGADEERLLNVQGISRYDQIARWTSSDVARFERLLNNEGRISRENWIEQAQILARGGETAYSREFDRLLAATAPAPPRPTQLAEAIRTAQQPARKVDLQSLRSVRPELSEAVDGGQPNAGIADPASRGDDLKRIRGIGAQIEKQLNSMGYHSYEQVANWTAADVARVSQALDFRGRIERENWVEQARILASGGQTEFARRLDRSELDKNRDPGS